MSNDNKFAAQLHATVARVESAANKKKAQNLILIVNKKAVADMLRKQSVSVDDMTKQLYACEKAFKFVNEMTREHIESIEQNTFVVMKSLLNAQKLNVNLTKNDVKDAIFGNKDAAAHVYQRKNVISSQAQVDITFDALKIMRVVDVLNSTTVKARDCELLNIAREKLDNMTL